MDPKQKMLFGWSRDTWNGVSSIFSGAACQWGMGVYAMWAGIAVYFTSKYQAVSPELRIETTLYTVPITLMSLTAAMQLGAWLFHKIDIRQQIMFGASLFCAGIYFAQFMKTYAEFILCYCILSGIGMGVFWVLPVECAWSYFPNHRAPVAGSIFSWMGISTIFWSWITKNTVNPNGVPGSIIMPNATEI